MARIQILNLPGDGHPFALVIDQINDTGAMVEIMTASDAAAQIGARTVFAFEETIEIAGQGNTPALRTQMLQLADKLDADADGFGGGKYQGWQEAAEQIRAILDGTASST